MDRRRQTLWLQYPSLPRDKKGKCILKNAYVGSLIASVLNWAAGAWRGTNAVSSSPCAASCSCLESSTASCPTASLLTCTRRKWTSKAVEKLGNVIFDATVAFLSGYLSLNHQFCAFFVISAWKLLVTSIVSRRSFFIIFLALLSINVFLRLAKWSSMLEQNSIKLPAIYYKDGINQVGAILSFEVHRIAPKNWHWKILD